MMETISLPNQDQELKNVKKYNTIGTRPIRHDGTDKVTGKAQYGADIHLPGMLYGAVLRSPYSHARIVSIDTSKAEALDGVKAVITAKDLPNLESKIAELGEGAGDVRYQSMNVLAQEKVLYYGHAVAAVSAVTVHIAKEALKLVDVAYEELQPVLDVRKAMEESAPILLDDLRTKEMGKKGEKPTNIANHTQLKFGDTEKGFAESDVIIEREFTTSMVHQGYIEPINATALYNNNGQVTIWTSTQAAFIVRDQIAELLLIPVSNINVIPMEIGGGFGGKISVYLEPLGILLSKKSGNRPVKLVMSRTEVLTSTGPTSGSFIKVKIGVKSSGKIVSAQAELKYEAGCFPGSPVGAGCVGIFSCYKIDNFQVDGYDVVVNKPKVEAYRAPGVTNATFAGESVIDELCEKLNMDPIEFRLLNAVKEGDRRMTGPLYSRIGYIETLEAAKAHPHYNTKLIGVNKGRGVASGFWGNYAGKSSVSASLNSDGTVNLLEGSTDIGGSRTSIAMMLAESLEIPVTDIKPIVPDTNSVGYTEGTYGSRTTFTTGWAAYDLGQKLKELLIERAANNFETEPKQVTYTNGIFSFNDKKLTFKELTNYISESGSPVSVSTSIRPKNAGPSFATHIVDVDVDYETGKVQILRYTAVQDVGKAIHPSYVEGQIQGGVAQGVGWALNEEYMYDEQGKLINSSFLDYRIPTSYDLPMIDTVLVEVPEPNHPYGVRGAGEVPITPPPAAIANAIANATGKRIRHLPMSPRTLFETFYGEK